MDHHHRRRRVCRHHNHHHRRVCRHHHHHRRRVCRHHHRRRHIIIIIIIIIIISAPKKPILPETYRLTVECNIQDKNYSTDYTEFFDYYNKRAAVHQWEEGFHAYGIYSYNTNELLTVVETQPRKE